MLLAIVVILILNVLNGVLAMSELAIVSARRTRLQQRADAGSTGAPIAIELAEQPDRFLSTVQIGITLIGILAGLFGGARLAGPVADLIEPIPGIGRYSAVIGSVLTVALITYLSLVIGELVPKRLALQSPEAIAVAMARPMQVLSRVAAPVVTLLAASGNFILRLLGNRSSNEPPVTEEEVRLLLRQGTQAGVFAEIEQELVDAVFRFGDRRVGELMTPRHRVVFLDVEDAEATNRAKMAAAPHSRFPVCEGDLDRVLGILAVKDLWTRGITGERVDLSDFRPFLTSPLFLPESLPASKAFDRFEKALAPFALVVDEYGSVTGILTLHDLFEAIAGDLAPAGEAGEEAAIRRADGSWLFDGSILIDELRDLLDLDALPLEVEGAYQTLGGYLMAELGHIPVAADIVTWDSWRFEVMDMDGNRVDKVLATRSEE